jgi:hypothetical protein
VVAVHDDGSGCLLLLLEAVLKAAEERVVEAAMNLFNYTSYPAGEPEWVRVRSGALDELREALIELKNLGGTDESD